MSHPSPSPLLTALEQAQRLIQAQQAAPPAVSSSLPEALESDRGSLRSWPASQPTSAAPTVAATEAHLAEIGTQLVEVQQWLHDHPDLLRLLDEGIRNEVQQMEHRINRTALLFNTLFTLLGTLLGLALPPLLGWLAHLLGY